jgi:hypothetical protein
MQDTGIFYLWSREKESNEWEPAGVWQDLGSACCRAIRKDLPSLHMNIHSLKYSKCTTWLPDGKITKTDIINKREIRYMARQCKKEIRLANPDKEKKNKKATMTSRLA